MKFAVDFGRSTLKAAADEFSMIIPSGYERCDYSSGSADEMEVNGQFYTFHKRGPVEAEPLDSDRMMMCTLYAIANYMHSKNAAPQEHAIELGIDIPISRTSKQREQYKNYYQGKKYCIGYKGNRYRIIFSKVFPMPQGAVAFTVNADAYKDYDHVLVLDVGSRTVDWIDATHDEYSGKWNFLRSGTIQFGIINILDTIKEDLQIHGINVPEHTIERAIAGKVIQHRESATIEESADKLAGAYAGCLLSELIERDIDWGVPTVLVGGGATLLHSRLAAAGLNIIDDLGIMENANGIKACLDWMVK